MKKIYLPYNGKTHSISYKIETIDLSMTPVSFLNVYSVFVDDEEMRKIIGDHFTILHNSLETIKPCFESSDNIDIFNLKKTIAQQIMNSATE